jgi:hypothetical protein
MSCPSVGTARGQHRFMHQRLNGGSGYRMESPHSMLVSDRPFYESGQITCSRKRSDHVLPTFFCRLLLPTLLLPTA